MNTETSRLVFSVSRQAGQIHVVRKDGFQAKIYETPSGPCTITWHEPARPGRQRTMRADLERARTFAKTKLGEIAKGESWRTRLSESDYSAHLRWIEIAQKTPGVPVEVLLNEAVEARQKNPRTGIVAKNCPELVAELLAVKRREKKCGEKHLRNLESQLERLAQYFPGPLHLVEGHDLNAWLRSLKGGLDYRWHHRKTAIQLVNFAKTINAVPRESFCEAYWDSVEDLGRARPQKAILESKDFETLLRHSRPKMIPFIICQAFAGIRHEELRSPDPRKVPLDWSDFDWEEKEINISEETGKTGDRKIPMADNLIAWLKDVAKTSGPVCELQRPDSELNRIKQRAGLPSKKGQTRNALRKSFGSYRLGQVKNNYAQVAGEMGNSEKMIKKYYRKPKNARQAKAWFGILPTSSGITQQEFAGI